MRHGEGKHNVEDVLNLVLKVATTILLQKMEGNKFWSTIKEIKEEKIDFNILF